MRILFITLFYSLVSCQLEQETNAITSLSLTIDEVKVAIPGDVPNDWIGITSSFENNERLLYIYDMFSLNIIKYSLDKEEYILRISPFSDTLNPGNIPMNILKLDTGYLLFDINSGFVKVNDQGKLLKIWDCFIPRNGRIKDWNYDFKYWLRPSKNKTISTFDNRSIPLYVELANVSPRAVYQERFYDHDLLATLNLEEGTIERFPIRFPKDFLNNGLSYPRSSVPSFTAMGSNKIAYNFGVDDVIHVLNINTREVVDFSVVNNEVPINILPVDENTYNDRDQMAAILANSFYYNHLFYDPYRKALVRVGVKTVNNVSSRIFELIDENMKIVAQFEQPSQYSPIPLFFPNEMWFPFQQGYAEDEMKLMRVRY
jgi:hypothetical protein